MVMSMYGNDWKYANSRLEETIVRIGGRGFFVREVLQDCSVTGNFLDEKNLRVVKLQDLDLTPVKLGFCNFNNQVSYLVRMPMRRDWRQGLRRGNFTSLTGFPSDLIPYTELAKVIEGKYPTLKDALENADKALSKAWCREWAIEFVGNSKHIIYKNFGAVGRILRGKPVLNDKFSYLQESLEESL